MRISAVNSYSNMNHSLRTRKVRQNEGTEQPKQEQVSFKGKESKFILGNLGGLTGALAGSMLLGPLGLVGGGIAILAGSAIGAIKGAHFADVIDDVSGKKDKDKDKDNDD